jgi:hypothetical protein
VPFRAEAYFKNNGMRWLKELDRGKIVEFNENDSNWSAKSLPKAQKNPAAK